MSLFRPLALLVILAMPCLAVADNLPVYSTGVFPSNVDYPLNRPYRVDGVYASIADILSVLSDVNEGILDLPAAVVKPDPSWGVQPTYNPDPEAANWINPETDFGCSSSQLTDVPFVYDGSVSCAGGFYYYHPLFDLSGFYGPSLRITGRFAGDNAVWLYAFSPLLDDYQLVASAPYGPPYSYDTWTPFELKGYSAANFFFIVENGNGTTDTDGPTGLIVDITSATGSPVPEPDAVALFGTGLLFLFGLMNRRHLRFISPRI